MRGFAVLLLIASTIIVPFLLFGDTVEALVTDMHSARANPWFVAAAVFVLLASDIVLPIPSSVVATASGSMLGLFAGTLVSAAGLIAGTITGLLFAARFGERAARSFVGEVQYALIERLLVSYGIVILVVLRPVPVLAEASVIAAGAFGVPLRTAIAYTSLANMGLALGYAALGSAATGSEHSALIYAASLLPPAIAMMVARLTGLGVARRLSRRF